MCMILLSGVLMYMHHGGLETIGYPLAFLLTCTVYTHMYIQLVTIHTCIYMYMKYYTSIYIHVHGEEHIHCRCTGLCPSLTL